MNKIKIVVIAVTEDLIVHQKLILLLLIFFKGSNKRKTLKRVILRKTYMNLTSVNKEKILFPTLSRRQQQNIKFDKQLPFV